METVQRVVILPEEELGEVSPYLHGQFAEHLGACIYPGIYVDPRGPIPNRNGLRTDVIEALQPLEIPVLRWPGGCFADAYHWRDGIGPQEMRPKRVNYHWGMAEESNQFGTHEFMNFCRAINTEPYFAGNVGSGSVAELRDWVEYCNFAGSSHLARERQTNGAADPFRIRFWGVGNENWGCGGNMSPEEYAAQFARYRSFVFNFSGTEISAIACGPSSRDFAWTRRFFHVMKNQHTSSRMDMVQAFAAHYYCGTTGSATEYTDDQWLEMLSRAYAIEGIITGHRAIMDEYDPQRNVKLIVDEWGTWHAAAPDVDILMQQNTLRDAAVAALTLDIFNNQADKVYMANIAQLINVLQALLLVEGDRCIKTPTYHVFELYKPHRNGHALRFVNLSERVSDGGAAAEQCTSCYLDSKPFALQAAHGSATRKGNMLCITAVNTHPNQSIELDVELYKNRFDSVEVVALTAADIHAHNTFERPDVVKLSPAQTLKAQGEHIRVAIPAGSIIRILGAIQA